MRTSRGLVASLLLVGGWGEEAGAQPFRVDPAPAAFSPLPLATVLTTAADDEVWTVDLPFSFRFFDAAFTQVVVDANGGLAFAPTRALGFANRVPGQGVASYVAPFWDDLRLFAAANGRIAWAVEGSAPSRRFGVEWIRVGLFDDPAVELSFRVWLHEGRLGRIDFEYGEAVAGTFDPEATIGLTGPAFSGPLELGGCSPTCGLASWPGPDRRITLRRDRGPDLAIERLDAPGIVVAGRPAAARLEVFNDHGVNLGPFFAVLDLPGGERVGQLRTTVGAFTGTVLEIPFTVPAGASGRTTIVATLDPAQEIQDVDRTNNRAETTVGVLPAGANLAVAGVGTDRLRAAAGSTIAVSVRVESNGALASLPAELVVALSSNRVITERDLELSRVALLPLEPGESAERSLVVALPENLSSGPWFLGARIVAATLDVDPTDDAAAADAPIVVDGVGLQVIAGDLPAAYVGAEYRVELAAAGVGPTGRARWRLDGGELPAGLSLGEDGTVFGTPEAPGSTRFTVRAEAASGSATGDFGLDVLRSGAPLSVPIAALPTGSVGRPYRAEIPLVGQGAVDASVTMTGVPAGLSAAGAVLAGIPTEPGRFEVEVGATSGEQRAQRAVALEIRDGGPLRLHLSFPPASAGAPVSLPLPARGGVDPLSFAGRGLPDGLTVTPGGRLEGVSPRPGRYRFEVEVRDAEGDRDERTAVFDVEAASGDGPPFAPSLPVAVRGAAYRALVTAEGAVVERREGRWPAGLEEEASEGGLLISGVPTEAGRFEQWLVAVDPLGRERAAVATLVVRDGPVAPSGGCRTAPAGFGLGPLLWVGLGGFARRRKR